MPGGASKAASVFAVALVGVVATAPAQQTDPNPQHQDRESRQKPRELIAALQIRPGDVVADIGTGRGFMIPYLVEAVGPEGKVIAEDIRRDFVSLVTERAESEKWSNVAVVLGTEQDPRLPAGTLNLALVVMAYHEFQYPGEMLEHIRRALKADGRLVVVEDGKGHFRTNRKQLAREIEANGFQLLSQFDHAGGQYVLIFRKHAG